MGSHSDICICSTCDNETLHRTVYSDGGLFEDCAVCGYRVETVYDVASRSELLEMRRELEQVLEDEELEDFRRQCKVWDRRQREGLLDIFAEEEGERASAAIGPSANGFGCGQD